MPMMAITTSSSTSVKPILVRFVSFIRCTKLAKETEFAEQDHDLY